MVAGQGPREPLSCVLELGWKRPQDSDWEPSLRVGTAVSSGLIYSLTYPIIIVAMLHSYFGAGTKDRPEHFRKKSIKSGYFVTLRLETSHPRISGLRRNKEHSYTSSFLRLRASHWICITNKVVICPSVNYINYLNKFVHPFLHIFFSDGIFTRLCNDLCFPGYRIGVCSHRCLCQDLYVARSLSWKPQCE